MLQEDIRELENILRAQEQASFDVHDTRQALAKVISSTNRGLDTSKLFHYVIRCFAISDIVVQKLACWYIRHYSDREDVVLLCVSSLLKNTYDANPLIRGLGLKTLTSLHVNNIQEFAIPAIERGLQDHSAYVRRVAVVSCTKLGISLEELQECGFVDQLYRMIRDSDPIVVVNCLSVLEEILSAEEGIVINRNIALYLLAKLNSFSDWNLLTVLVIVKKFRPKSEDEALDIMNLIDPFLKHNNSAVVIAAMEYFLLLVKNMPQLHGEVFKRAKTQILHHIGSDNPELTFSLLEYIDTILVERKTIFQSHHNSFFCKYSEPVFVKVKKITMLPQLSSDTNYKEIVEELAMYCMDINTDVANAAVSSISHMTRFNEVTFTTCVDKLFELLDMRLDYVANQILKALETVDLKNYANISRGMQTIKNCLELSLSSSGLCSTLWLLGEYGDILDDCPCVIEELISNNDEFEVCIKIALLSAVTKLFIKRPPEFQHVLGVVFEMCHNCDNCDVADKCAFYYSLLKSNTILSTEIICSA